MPLRIGVHHAVARAPLGTRTAIEDTAALLSRHGHRVVDLAAGRTLVSRLLRRDPAVGHLHVLLHTGPLGPDFPCLARVPVDGPDGQPVDVGLAARAGLAGEVRELVRLILLDQPALVEASA
ncbi:hypothetical protein ACFQV2_03090 [Actinokineospora soli]|uniref:Uncharacterized protein n=1 Tax=Actinokineospora soli TaxID=1048753 RepID=A0ABW2TH55_9PSEU